MSEDLFKDRYLSQEVVVERDYVTRTVAVDRILGREVLITQLNGRVGRRAAVQDRFRNAARAAVRLSHPNIIALYDIGSANGFPYSVQEHTHSESLTDIIEHEGPFHPDDVAVLVEHVASALDYAHLRDIAHLALSPSVITVDYDGQALVSDFGIGQVLAEIAPTDVAKLSYQAPELISREQGEPASDIFSLGVIAYEMLAGLHPFDISSTDAIRASLSACEPRSLSVVNPDVPRAVSDVVHRALAKDPQQRFQTAGHFAEAINNWREHQLDSQPVYFGSLTGELEPTDAMPLAPHPVSSVGEHLLDRDEPVSRRGTAFAAWLGLAIGLTALIWITFSLLDDRNNGSESNGNNVAGASPASSATTTATALSAPTAISLIGMTLDDASAATDLSIRAAATSPAIPCRPARSSVSLQIPAARSVTAS